MNFVIVTARYISNSNGIKILHKLCHTINKLGGDARLLFINSSEPSSQTIGFHDDTWTNKELNTPVLKREDQDFIQDAYVLYPETIIANPVKAKRVIRYFGNKEGYCSGRAVIAGTNDFIVAHSRVIHPNPHYVLFNADINPAFNDVGTEPYDQRTLDATYIGKGYIYGGTGILPNTLYIAREWPNSQEQLALVMRNTRFFYTWDAWTATNVEAVLCGAVPVILSYDPWTPEEIDSSELGWLPRASLIDEQIGIDANAFKTGREAIMGRISELSVSWEKRVEMFMEKVRRHFSC